MTIDTTSRAGFLAEPPESAAGRLLFDADTAELGHVMNLTRLWAHQPELKTGLFGLLGEAITSCRMDIRQRGILVTACASTLGDSYCSLAWGEKLAKASDAETAACVLRGDDSRLTDRERAMAAWARKVARDPNATTADDVDELRDAGFEEDEIFAITVFVALRLAFSTVNDALGARPDATYRTNAPAQVRDVVDYGRPIAESV
jgi:alkylhydroperoxidase family enzyme